MQKAVTILEPLRNISVVSEAVKRQQEVSAVLEPLRSISIVSEIVKSQQSVYKSILPYIESLKRITAWSETFKNQKRFLENAVTPFVPFLSSAPYKLKKLNFDTLQMKNKRMTEVQNAQLNTEVLLKNIMKQQKIKSFEERKSRKISIFIGISIVILSIINIFIQLLNR